MNVSKADRTIAAQAKRITELEVSSGEIAFQLTEVFGTLRVKPETFIPGDMVAQLHREVVKLRSRVVTLEAALEVERTRPGKPKETADEGTDKVRDEIQ